MPGIAAVGASRPLAERGVVLGRIELGGVRGEVVDVKAAMIGQERTDLATSMDGATIPQQVDGTAQVAEQMLEEGADVEAREIRGRHWR